MNSGQLCPRHIRVGHRIRLERCQSWDEGFHVFDETSAFAVEMALATGRPLLVRGEPGSGKSQLARAAAQELNRCLLAEVVSTAAEGQDLLWQYDPVARLGDAQLLAAEAAFANSAEPAQEADSSEQEEQLPEAAALALPDLSSARKMARHKKKKSARQRLKNLYKVSRTPVAAPPEQLRLAAESKASRPLHPGNYISPGILWWAFDCESARRQYAQCRYPAYRPCLDFGGSDLDRAARQGFVLLIDEIDKADPSLPNALLEVLGNGSFHVPLLNETVGMRTQQARPLVIITTNEERELPPAFIRRCLVLHLRLDNEQQLRAWWSRQAEQQPAMFRPDQFTADRALIKWLAERGEVHFEQAFTDRVREKAAELLVRDRREAKQHGLIKPGQAEYLDLLRALRDMPGPESGSMSREQHQLVLLEKVSAFALVKSPLD